MTEAGPLLAVQGIRKRFGDFEAVRGLSFEVRAGEVFGFLGPNGAGKTTSLRMLMNITRPDAGSVTFMGGPVMDRRLVGYLPEERGLFEDATLIDTLVYLGTLRGMSRADARAEGKRWLERLGFTERLTARLNTLSKGNQQKVQFLGAVIHRPALAVLDEPFSGLDPLNQELFLDLIGELRARGAAVLLSAHQLTLAERLCDRLLLIANGAELLSGTLDEIRLRAAGGASEEVKLELRRGAGGGSGDPVAAVARVAPGVECRAGEEREGLVTLDVALPAGSDLGPLLAELARAWRIERISTSALSLHEIYVRAVRGADPAAAAAPLAPAGEPEAHHA
ncbi:MAG: ATP-binding cassette domain-containing protein [Candidatus Eisenbacteria bacterium]|nr:ATP-binding cassette domain-containing protein [Candidatus Eisenbacteria bacterium]